MAGPGSAVVHTSRGTKKSPGDGLLEVEDEIAASPGSSARPDSILSDSAKVLLTRPRASTSEPSLQLSLDPSPSQEVRLVRWELIFNIAVATGKCIR